MALSALAALRARLKAKNPNLKTGQLNALTRSTLAQQTQRVKAKAPAPVIARPVQPSGDVSAQEWDPEEAARVANEAKGIAKDRAAAARSNAMGSLLGKLP